MGFAMEGRRGLLRRVNRFVKEGRWGLFGRVEELC